MMIPKKVLDNFFKILFLVLYLKVNTFTCAQEVLVQINLRKPINTISDRFVSFSIDPNILVNKLNSSESNNADFMAIQLSPAYLKIAGDSFFMLTEALSHEEIVNKSNLNDDTPQILWKNFNEWMRSVGWKSVIPIPYAPNKWDCRETLNILNISSLLGVSDCVWQLGLDFNATRAADYAADLKTLKSMVTAFRPWINNWEVVGADISAGSDPNETALYTELAENTVSAIGWTQSPGSTPIEYQNSMAIDRDLALKVILNSKSPAWLSLPKKSIGANDVDLNSKSISEGLQWAQILGNAAQSGFSVVFKPLEESEMFKPTLSFYVSLMFKRTMGENVFETRSIAGDRYSADAYCHCAKGIPGSIAIMGVNMANHRTKITTRILAQYTSVDVLEYIFTVKNGQVLLNDEPIQINSTFKAFIKIRKPNVPVPLTLPSTSVGFWVFPSMNISDCHGQAGSKIKKENTGIQKAEETKFSSSSDALLHQLIKESLPSLERQMTKTNDVVRQKRHVVIKKDSNSISQNDNTIMSSRNLQRRKRFILTAPKLLPNVAHISNLIDLKLYETKHRLKNSFPRILLKNLEFLTLPAKRLRRQVDVFGTGEVKPKIELPALRGPLFGKLPKLGKTPLLGRQRPQEKFVARVSLPPYNMGPRRFAKNAREAKVGPGLLPTVPIHSRITGPHVWTKAPVDPKFGPGLLPGRLWDPRVPDNERLVNTDQKLYEEKIFESRENLNLPKGDVYIELSKSPSPDYDYVEFDEGRRKNIEATDEESFGRVPNAFHESFNVHAAAPWKNTKSQGELWEVAGKGDQQFDPNTSEALPEDLKLGYVLRELEPTWNQNYQQLQKAHENLRTYYMQPPTDLADTYKQQQQQHRFQGQQAEGEIMGYPQHSEEDDFFFEQQPALNYPQLRLKNPVTNSKRYPRSINAKSENRENLIAASTKEADKFSKKRLPRNTFIKFSPMYADENSNRIDQNPRLPFLPSKNYDKSKRPEYWATVQKENTTPSPDHYGLTAKAIEFDKYSMEKLPSDGSINQQQNTESLQNQPKYIQMVSDSMSNFVEMINRHVTGWWNTWS